MTAAALLLAAAVLLSAGPGPSRRLMSGGSRIRTDRCPAHPDRDPFATASALDVLSVCLAAGMPIPAAAAATAAIAPPALGAQLARASELLSLGADAGTAWQLREQSAEQQCVALARLARRSASSGSALAQSVSELAAQSRQEVQNSAVASAERAGVLIAGPLGLCFLPAFVCLGIVPVVAGLAGEIFGAVLP
ncbi:MAG: type II secretion system F family protein [Mycobacterium sp.]